MIGDNLECKCECVRKYTCCSCYFHKARCFQKLEFLDQETLMNVSSDSRNRVELVLPRRWLELLQTPNLNDISCRFRISKIVSISKI